MAEPQHNDRETAQPQLVEGFAAALRAERVHHAYLLVGADPAAATAAARAFALRLVCTEASGSGDRSAATSGCGACPSCRRFAAGTHQDVATLAPNEKDVITVDMVRALTARLGFKATLAPRRVVLIERGDRMNPAAQNALLKTLEEPPGSTCFLITATRLRALLVTVRSRCQKVRLRPALGAGAAAALASSGIAAPVAQLLAPLVGSNTEEARELVEQGAADIVERLAECLQPSCDPATLVRVAADLSADAARAELAQALIEVLLRDRLARLHGAADDQLYAPLVAERAASVRGQAASRAAAQLLRLRQQRVYNPNKTLALESVLLALLDRAPTAVTQ